MVEGPTESSASAPEAADVRRAASLRARLRFRRSRLQKSGMGALPGPLIVACFIGPARFADGTIRGLLRDALVTLILLVGVLAIVGHRRSAVVLAGLAPGAIAMRWMGWIDPTYRLPGIRATVIAAALIVLAAVVSIEVFAPNRGIAERLSGAIVLHLPIGLIRALIHRAFTSRCLAPLPANRVPARTMATGCTSASSR